MRRAALLLVVALLAMPLCAAERRIELDAVVAASVDDVWSAWTTVEGVKAFFAADAKHTKVRLVHDGFGDTEEWIAVHGYFTKAWGEFVLPRLQARFDP